MRLSGKVGKKGGDLLAAATHWQTTLVLYEATHKLTTDRTRHNRTNSPKRRGTLTRRLILTHGNLNAKGGPNIAPRNKVNFTLSLGKDRPQTLPSTHAQQNPTHITPVVTTQACAHTLTGKHPHGGRKRPTASLFEVG